MGEIVKAMHLQDLNNLPKPVPSRDGYGHGLLWLCENNPNVLVLDADLAKSTRTNWVWDKYPDRFIDIGIAEQNMLGFAGGLALGGKIPFVTTYGVFVSGRAWDQIRTSICYGELNVKMGGAHGGISVGPDGATHQSLEEITLMRVLPNMTVIGGTDWIEVQKATIWAAQEHVGPVYLRFGREAVPVITTEQTPFRWGKCEVYRTGNDVAIIANGVLVYEALKAAEKLAKQGIDARVINCHTIKPLDKETIQAAAEECKAVVTAEEHSAIGGLGGAVAEFLGQNCPTPMRIIGIEDRFGESGQPDELMCAFGMTCDNIEVKVKEVLKMKK
jgi:transketolase